MLAGESAQGLPGGVDAPEAACAPRATARAAAETVGNRRGGGLTARNPPTGTFDLRLKLLTVSPG